jgi:hypothetical protein
MTRLWNFISEVAAWLWNPNGPVGLLIAAVLVLDLAVAVVSVKSAQRYARSWISPIAHTYHLQLEPQPSSSLCFVSEKERQYISDALIKGAAGKSTPAGANAPGASPAVVERLIQQLQAIRSEATLHLRVMTFFYSRYYMAIDEVFINGALAAIALFFITRVGWEAANKYVIAVFVVATTATAYFAAYPVVFQQQQNIGAHRALLVKYLVLQNDLLTFVATHQQGGITNAAEMANYVNDQLGQLEDFTVGFDITQVPTFQGIFQKAATAVAPPTATPAAAATPRANS